LHWPLTLPSIILSICLVVVFPLSSSIVILNTSYSGFSSPSLLKILLVNLGIALLSVSMSV
jgi:hypothetical protein